jgi:hypothetical protein
LSRKGEEGPSFKIPPKISYGIAPKSKWPTRFSRIDHSPAPARYGSRNHLAAIPCPVLTAMPRHFSDKTLENNRQRDKE